MAASREQLEQALIAADAAGDAEGATILAQELRSFSQAPAPKAEAAPYFSAKGQGQLLDRRLNQAGLIGLQAAKPMSGLMAAAAEALPEGSAPREYFQGLPLRVSEASDAMREKAEGMNPEGFDVGDVEEFATQVALTGPAAGVRAAAVKAGAGPVARAATAVANRATQGAAAGAALGNQTGDTAEAAKLGAAVNLAVPVAGKVLGGIVRGTSKDSAAARLAKEGVKNITPGGIIGGAAKRGEEALGSVPVLGAAVKASQRKGIESFNLVAINKTLEPIGQKLPDGYVGRAAIAQANKRLSDAYNELLPKVVAREDGAFRADLQKLVSSAAELPPKQQELLTFVLKNELAAKLLPGGTVKGEALKRIESKLGTLAMKYGKSADPYDNQMAETIKDAQSSLRALLARNNPQYAERLKNINEGYSLFKRVQRASRMAGSKKGVFSPEALRSAVTALDPSKDKSATAKGMAKMQKFAEDAEEVLGSRVPDSGTAERVGMGALLSVMGGGTVVSPGVAGPIAAGMLPYLPGGRQAAQALLMRRPDSAVPLAAALEGAASGPAAIPLSNLLLNGGP